MPVAIRSAACRFPDSVASIEDIFAEEGVELTSETRARLGVSSVHLCDGVSGSELALDAAHEALDAAGIAASRLDVIVDFTILPQEYLVPAWSMGNKLQAELGAKRAFTLGFSGGGASNFQVALSSAAALLQNDDGVDTALLVAADVAIPGNRVLGGRRPATVLGDGASAVVMQSGGGGDEVIGTRIKTFGELHDVCYIRGGAMEHPDRSDLYRLDLDVERAARATTALAEVCAELLESSRIDREDVSLTTTNISLDDRAALADTLGSELGDGANTNLARHGHVQGTDLVLNYLGAREAGRPVLLASHGMGFMPAASLLDASEGARE